MTPTESFVSHLIELRNRLIKIVVGMLVVFLGLFPFANKVYALLAAPMLDKLPEGTQMIATAVVTPFFVPMKVAIMAAFVIALPHTLYQLWMFVAPGLYAHEKKMMLCHCRRIYIGGYFYATRYYFSVYVGDSTLDVVRSRHSIRAGGAA